MSDSNKKIKIIRYWPLKIFFITIIIAAGFSLVAEVFAQNLPIWAAAIVLILIIILGIIFDTIGLAVAVCDEKPFIAMASKKIKRAKQALALLKNAEVVSNLFGDVFGDICGIVSGAAGAAIAIKIILSNPSISDFILGIAFSSVIAALTVAGKAIGKTLAIKYNKEIVSFLGYILSLFKFSNK